jgi:hypothetical protein
MCAASPPPGCAAHTRAASSAGIAGGWLHNFHLLYLFTDAGPLLRGSAAHADPYWQRESIWHGGCRKWLDPPFGGLWCDQPALFLLAQSAASCRFARARGIHSFDPATPGNGPGVAASIAFERCRKMSDGSGVV